MCVGVDECVCVGGCVCMSVCGCGGCGWVDVQCVHEVT